MTHQSSNSQELRSQLLPIVSPVNRNENSSLGSSTPNEAVDKILAWHQKEVDKIVEAVERQSEVWLPVPLWTSHYEVSNQGRVRSVERMTLGRWDNLKRSPAKIRKPDVDKNGYQRVQFSRNGERSRHLVHRLVASAFIPNDELKPCVNHIDNDPSNNRVANLEWVTHKENTAHATAQDRFNRVKGTDHPNTQKTHCLKGHEYAGSNLYLHKSGRYCRACRAETNKKINQRKRYEALKRGGKA